MFVGHFAAALAAKAVEPRAPLWSYVAATQLLDIVWGVLMMTGVEHARLAPSLLAGPMLFDFLPFSHSLPAAVIWSLLAAFAARKLLKLPGRAALWLGIVVFSHWLLDLVVHRPDLPLGFGGRKVGFAMWDLPLAEATFEIGLLGLAAIFWAGKRLPFAAYFVLLVGLQCATQVMPLPDNKVELGVTTVILLLLLAGIAALLEPKPQRTESGRKEK